MDIIIIIIIMIIIYFPSRLQASTVVMPDNALVRILIPESMPVNFRMFT